MVAPYEASGRRVGLYLSSDIRNGPPVLPHVVMLPGKIMSPRASSGWFGRFDHSIDEGGCGGACGAVGDAEGSSIRSTGMRLVSAARAPE